MNKEQKELIEQLETECKIKLINMRKQKQTRLTKEEWSEIEEQFRNKSIPIPELSKKYNISRNQIYLHMKQKENVLVKIIKLIFRQYFQ